MYSSTFYLKLFLRSLFRDPQWLGLDNRMLLLNLHPILLHKLMHLDVL